MGRLISPRVREAFGGREAVDKTLDIVSVEFLDVFESMGVEAVGIAAVKSSGNCSFRFWSDQSDYNYSYIPVAEITRLLCNDDIYEYGWVFCHSHTGRDPDPSEDDDKATCLLAWLGKILDRPLVDHWIFAADGDGIPNISRSNFYSYSARKPKTLSPRLVFES